MIIVGSVAAYHWFPSKWRLPKDIDVLTTEYSKLGDRNINLEVKQHGLVQRIIDQSLDKVFADPDTLYTLKLSHSNWDIHWNKTLYDVHLFKELKCKIREDLYTDLVGLWKIIHGKKKVNLNKPVDEFFKDYVVREHDHEFLHELVKFDFKPKHELIRKDLSNALVDRDLWSHLSFNDKCLTALEEIMVVAIERGHLNKHSKKIEVLNSIRNSHKLLCTSMTTGFFQRFLVEYHHEILVKRKTIWEPHLTAALQRLPTKT